jgi:hypothetical protein
MVTNPAPPAWLLELIDLCNGSKSIGFSGVDQPNASSRQDKRAAPKNRNRKLAYVHGEATGAMPSSEVI